MENAFLIPHVFFIAAGNAFPKFRHYDDAVLNRLLSFSIFIHGYNISTKKNDQRM
jgi:hypothetical protein